MDTATTTNKAPNNQDPIAQDEPTSSFGIWLNQVSYQWKKLAARTRASPEYERKIASKAKKDARELLELLARVAEMDPEQEEDRKFLMEKEDSLEGKLDDVRNWFGLPRKRRVVTTPLVWA